MVLVSSSPAGGTGQPLQPLSHNAQRESELFSPSRRIDFADATSPSRDSSVHEKINQFNTLALQSKTLERKTADAALKRAMLGREEAEAEMRRYRDEARSLRKQVEDGKDRERRVGERLEAVMENYGRAKETHTHTQQLWEKEIRRARKETFKAQSALVKLQEELKSCRTAQKAAEDELQAEREKSQALEQQSFNAQYSLVGLQEQLDQAQERAKMLQQELEAMKTLAKNEAEVSRLSEKHEADLDDDKTDAPRKRQRLSPAEDLAVTDPDVETLLMRWQWEKQRADRALEQVEFLEAECQLKICAAAKSLRRSSSNSLSSSRRKRASLLQISDAGDSMILSGPRRDSAEPSNPTPRRSKTDMLRAEKEPRRSTIFVPAEGIFRTVSQAEADAPAAKSVASSVVSPTDSTASLPITPTESDPMYRRTPSVDPPDFAVLTKERTSLLSLLNAPHRQDPSPVFNIPTTSGPEPEAHNHEMEDVEEEAAPTVRPSRELFISPLPEADPSLAVPLMDPLPSAHGTTNEDASLHPRPHTTTAYYPPTTTVTTTTKVPLREEPVDGPTLAQRLLRAQTQQQQQQQSQQQQQPLRTPSRQQTGTGTGMDGADDGADPDRPSFDATNPALTPTMTREQALAQIRERRGRARSVGRGPASGGGTTTTGGGGGGGASGLGSGTGSASSQGRTSRGESQHPNPNQTVRRKVSSGDGTHQQQQPVIRRKASGADFSSVAGAMGGTAASRGRERERDARREVSAPSATGGTGAGTVRGVVPGNTRRVRS